MLLDPKFASSFAKFEFRTERSLIRDQLPHAVDFAGVLDAKLKGLFICDEYVADVHLGNRQLRLGAFALTREVQRKPVLVASHVAECGA